MPFKRAALAAAVAAALPFSALAAEEVFVMPEVVVKGSKENVQSLPLNEADIGAEKLQSLVPASSDSASLLRDVPGVSLYGAGGVSSLPAIHGLADDRLRIKVDGIDLIAACPNHMNSPLSYIDPSAVAVAKVYAGVTPVSLGGDSIGGTIVVESAAPEFAKAGQGKLLKGEAGAYYRSNGNAVGGNLAATLASEQFSISYSGSIAKSDNYTAADDFKTYDFTGRAGHTLDLDEVGSSAYKSINQSVKLGWKAEDHLFEFKYGRQDVPYENYPNQRMDMTDNTSDQFSLAYTGYQDWGRIKARAYHEHTEHEMDFGDDKRFWYAPNGSGLINGVPCSPVGPTCAAGMPMYTDADNSGLTLSTDIWLAGGDTLRVGGEFQAYRLDDWWDPSGAGMWPDTFQNINDGERDRYAVFGEWEKKLSPQWLGLLGLRYEMVQMDTDDVHGYNSTTNGMGMMTHNQKRDADTFNALDHSITDHNWDLTALARYTPDATQAYELGLAQKTRSPNLYERYTWSTWSMAAVMNNYVGDGNGYVGNLKLDPEVARTVSLAADWHDASKKAWSMRVVPYYTYVTDYIDAQCLPGTTCRANQFNVLQYVNQSARLYGVDISGHVLVSSTPAYGDITLGGLLNYVDGENRDTGDNLYNIMPLNAKLSLTQKRGRWTNALEAQFVSEKDEVSQVRNEIKTDGYSLFNLRSSYAWKQVRLDVGIENLFDQGYDLPLGGAYLGQGTTMAINPPIGNYPQWGTAVPGPGRTLYAGVNVKF